MGFYNIADLYKLEQGLGSEIVMEAVKATPETTLFPAETIEGSSMPLTVNTALPSVAFRNANEGVARSKATYETRLFATQILDHQVAVDKASLNSRKPAARGRLLTNHMQLALEAAFRTQAKQAYYGTANDAKGFPGLIAQLPNDTKHVKAVGGSTLPTSIWLVRLGVETLSFIYGNDKTLSFNEDWKEETVYDTNSNPYQALVNYLTGNIGFRLANQNAAFRIKGVGTDTGKTANYDYIYAGLQKFSDELGWDPTHILMNGRSREQLRQSLITATNPNPTLPNDVNGIPIIVTPTIINGEAI